jgi:hypothetical protein
MTIRNLTTTLLLLALGLSLTLIGAGSAQAYHSEANDGAFAAYCQPKAGAPGYLYPAKMRVQRSTVDRRARALDMLAPITARASGRVKVKYEGDRRVDNFTAAITSNSNTALDQVRFREGLTSGQAALGQGIVTLSYPGDADTRPDEVRLRAASGRANLEVDYISNSETGPYAHELYARGNVTSRARGVIRFRYSYVDDEGQPQVWLTKTTIQRDGSWELTNKSDSLGRPMNNVFIPERLARCGGYLSILFTGYFPERIRGEMLAYKLNAGQTRRP